MNLRRILLVAAGGTAGTAARLLLGLALPDAGVLPVLLANIVGAFLIGVLMARPFDRLSDRGRAEVRVLLGTGALGGFTTYSSFMVGSVQLWTDAPALAVAYAAGSLLLGLAAAALGLRLGRPGAKP